MQNRGRKVDKCYVSFCMENVDIAYVKICTNWTRNNRDINLKIMQFVI